MAQTITCDSADGQPAAYLITDLSNGTTFAPCVQHWIDLCAHVTREAEQHIAESTPAPAPQPIDPPVDPSDPDNDVQQADQADDGGDGPVGTTPRTGPFVLDEDAIAASHGMVRGEDGGMRTPAAHEAHEARVRAELAERPDSAPDSESVTWSPEGGHA